MKTQTIGFIGGGRITRIILRSFQNKSIEFKKIAVYEPKDETATSLKKQFSNIDLASSPGAAAGQNMVFLAVHPPQIMETLEKVKDALSKDSTVISFAPKITIEEIASSIPTKKIIRMIPNATSYINEGVNPFTMHSSFNQDEKKKLIELLKVTGRLIEVEEKMLEGYAVVSAMLPTYFWFQWKKMEEIAVKTGFTETEARNLIGETLEKSGNLYYHSKLSPEEVMDLIPVKPIGENEKEIEQILETRLMGLYNKIKP